MSRRALFGAGIVVILLVLGVVGYLQGWSGNIFADVLFNGQAEVAIDDRADFEGGVLTNTEYKDGALQLKQEVTQ